MGTKAPGMGLWAPTSKDSYDVESLSFCPLALCAIPHKHGNRATCRGLGFIKFNKKDSGLAKTESPLKAGLSPECLDSGRETRTRLGDFRELRNGLNVAKHSFLRGRPLSAKDPYKQAGEANLSGFRVAGNEAIPCETIQLLKSWRHSNPIKNSHRNALKESGNEFIFGYLSTKPVYSSESYAVTSQDKIFHDTQRKSSTRKTDVSRRYSPGSVFRDLTNSGSSNVGAVAKSIMKKNVASESTQKEKKFMKPTRGPSVVQLSEYFEKMTKAPSDKCEHQQDSATMKETNARPFALQTHELSNCSHSLPGDRDYEWDKKWSSLQKYYDPDSKLPEELSLSKREANSIKIKLANHIMRNDRTKNRSRTQVSFEGDEASEKSNELREARKRLLIKGDWFPKVKSCLSKSCRSSLPEEVSAQNFVIDYEERENLQKLLGKLQATTSATAFLIEFVIYATRYRTSITDKLAGQSLQMRSYVCTAQENIKRNECLRAALFQSSSGVLSPQDLHLLQGTAAKTAEDIQELEHRIMLSHRRFQENYEFHCSIYETVSAIFGKSFGRLRQSKYQQSFTFDWAGPSDANAINHFLSNLLAEIDFLRSQNNDFARSLPIQK